MIVKIYRVTLPAWYANKIGQSFEVLPEPLQYSGGKGYMCTEVIGGILVRDCKVIEE